MSCWQIWLISSRQCQFLILQRTEGINLVIQGRSTIRSLESQSSVDVLSNPFLWTPFGIKSTLSGHLDELPILFLLIFFRICRLSRSRLLYPLLASGVVYQPYSASGTLVPETERRRRDSKTLLAFGIFITPPHTPAISPSNAACRVMPLYYASQPPELSACQAHQVIMDSGRPRT